MPINALTAGVAALAINSTAFTIEIFRSVDGIKAWLTERPFSAPRPSAPVPPGTATRCRTQGGSHDNETSWFDWTLVAKRGEAQGAARSPAMREGRVAPVGRAHAP